MRRHHLNLFKAVLLVSSAFVAGLSISTLTRSLTPSSIAPAMAADNDKTAGNAVAEPSVMQPYSDAEKARMGAFIRSYLLENPEIVMQSAQAFQQREEQRAADAADAALKTKQKELYENPLSPVVGNEKGDVTIVEFFDYNCHYCKVAAPDVFALVENDKKLKVVFKELPILGPGSETAARAALAAKKQGKYTEFHLALMQSETRLDDAAIESTAKKIGLDWEKLKTDMASAEISAYLQGNRKLAQSLNIRGTPGFIIGDHIAPGVLSRDEMKNRIQEIRDAKKG